MDIRFVNREAFVVAGYAVETNHTSNDKDLGELWHTYRTHLLADPESRSCLYGVLWYTENHGYYYLLGIEQRNNKLTDEQTMSVEIPAAQFAVAVVPGGMTAGEAWTEYFEIELPALGVRPDAAHGRYFEFYNQDGVCELWTPVTAGED